MDRRKLLEAAIADALDDHPAHSLNPERLMADEIVRLREARDTLAQRCNANDDHIARLAGELREIGELASLNNENIPEEVLRSHLWEINDRVLVVLGLKEEG